MVKSTTVVVLDLDGTLMNSQKELSARNRDVIIEFQRQGGRVVLASGRPFYGIMPVAKELEMERYGGYVLAYNGGSIFECSTWSELYRNELPQEVIVPMYEAAKRHGAVLLAHENEWVVSEDIEDKYVAFEAYLNKMKLRQVDNFVEYFSRPIPKSLAVAEPQVVEALEVELKAKFEGVISIYRSEPFFLELVPLGIDKAHSLGVLLDKIGGRREDMIAFGDGFNDQSMIEFAGTGVAMSNAQEAVKQVADRVTLSNDEDGVAEYIEREFNLNIAKKDA